jgi:hypothetical protein
LRELGKRGSTVLAPVQANEGDVRLQSERRQGVRHRLGMRVAKLRCRNGEYACLVHDVSEAGARVRLFHAHPPEDYMYLELAGGELYAMERRWIDGDFAGYRFSSPVDTGSFLRESGALPRRPMRLRVAHPVRLVVAGQLGHAVTVNLSAQGACIEAGRQVPLGSPVRLDLPGVAPRLASVCWREEFRHGLVFQEALRLDALARLALALQPFDAEPVTAGPAADARAIRA